MLARTRKPRTATRARDAQQAGWLRAPLRRTQRTGTPRLHGRTQRRQKLGRRRTAGAWRMVEEDYERKEDCWKGSRRRKGEEDEGRGKIISS